MLLFQCLWRLARLLGEISSPIMLGQNWDKVPLILIPPVVVENDLKNLKLLLKIHPVLWLLIFSVHPMIYELRNSIDINLVHVEVI